MALWIALNALYSEYQTGSERQAIADFVFSDKYKLSNQQMRAILDHSGAVFFGLELSGMLVATVTTLLKTQQSLGTHCDLRRPDSKR